MPTRPTHTHTQRKEKKKNYKKITTDDVSPAWRLAHLCAFARGPHTLLASTATSSIGCISRYIIFLFFMSVFFSHRICAPQTIHDRWPGTQTGRHQLALSSREYIERWVTHFSPPPTLSSLFFVGANHFLVSGWVSVVKSARAITNGAIKM